jgi:hypothetical protein
MKNLLFTGRRVEASESPVYDGRGAVNALRPLAEGIDY